MIVDKNGIARIQVKTAKTKSKAGSSKVHLRTMSNVKGEKLKIKYFDKNDCEFLFILTIDSTAYLIPSSEIITKNELYLNKKFDKWKVN